MTDSTSVTNWVATPGAFADLILEASVCGGLISGKVTAMEYDLAAHSGNTVRVRSFPRRAAQGPFTNCGCLTLTSSTMGYKDITVYAYGDADTMCGYSLWKASGPVKEGILNEMAKGLAYARDQALITAMLNVNLVSGVLQHFSVTSTVCTQKYSRVSQYCCTFKYNLYNSIVSLVAHMRADCEDPDTIIINPTVAKWLYFKDTAYPPPTMIEYKDGKLFTVAGLKVVETPAAPECVSTSGATQAIVINSRRCLGEVWGMHPKFEEERVPYCDVYRESVWMYWGCSVISVGAMGHIRNP